MTRILVVAAHPDDEVLGCGGTMARHAAEGDRVDILILAEGVTARDATRDAARRSGEIEARQEAARAAAGALGAEPPRFAGLPDNRLDTLPLLDVVRCVETAIEELAPSVLYTHHGGDLNVDHRVAHQAVLTACRPLPGTGVRAVYCFETVSSTEWASPGDGPGFRPTRFVDIVQTLERKRQALACYEAELRAFPHARSMEGVEALARLRGAGVGVDAAEAFEVIREIV